MCPFLNFSGDSCPIGPNPSNSNEWFHKWGSCPLFSKQHIAPVLDNNFLYRVLDTHLVFVQCGRYNCNDCSFLCSWEILTLWNEYLIYIFPLVDNDMVYEIVSTKCVSKDKKSVQYSSGLLLLYCLTGIYLICWEHRPCQKTFLYLEWKFFLLPCSSEQ